LSHADTSGQRRVVADDGAGRNRSYVDSFGGSARGPVWR
jgi:hypothetical protein